MSRLSQPIDAPLPTPETLDHHRAVEAARLVIECRGKADTMERAHFYASARAMRARQAHYEGAVVAIGRRLCRRKL